MRNVFLALLVANLAYFAWAEWIDVPKALAVNAAVARLPRLKLVSELPPPEAPKAAPGRTAYSEYSDTAPCMSVGPFADILSSAQAAELLKAKGFAARQRAAVGDLLEQYWVSVAGAKSDAGTLRVLKRLADHGIKDAEPVPDDPNHLISVGLFTDREQAQKRADAVRRLGLSADISEHKLPSAVYWVDLTPQAGVHSVPLQTLFAAGVNTKIGVQPCPAPAGAQASDQTAAPATAAPPRVAGAPNLQ